MVDLGNFSKRVHGTINNVLSRSMHRACHDLPAGRYVSLCFDDFPKSAVENAAPMIEARDWRATWYACGGFQDAQHELYGDMYTADDLQNLIRRGHDIGCHTYDHIDCAEADTPELIAQTDRNHAFLNQVGVDNIRSFAFPYGALNASSKKTMAASNPALRSVKPGQHRETVDLNLLYAVGLQDDKGGIARALEELKALETGDGWLIIFTHDIRDHPSPWGVTREDYARLLDAIEQSDADVVTVGDMVERIRAGAEAETSYAA